jgi:hypothetical protein
MSSSLGRVHGIDPRTRAVASCFILSPAGRADKGGKAFSSCGGIDPFADSEYIRNVPLKVVYTRSAERVAAPLPELVARINACAADPATRSIDVEMVKGQAGVRRIRWGDWRALFRVAGDEMQVFRIGLRKDVYRW